MADIYVNFTTGSDGGGDGSSGNPYKLISFALGIAGNNTIKCQYGADGIYLSQNFLTAVLIDGKTSIVEPADTAAGTITIAIGGSSWPVLIEAAASGADLTFNDITFDNTATTRSPCVNDLGSDTALTFNTCAFISVSSAETLSIITFNAAWNSTLVINGCTVNGTTDNSFVSMTDGTVSTTNNNITVVRRALEITGAAFDQAIVFTGNTTSSGVASDFPGGVFIDTNAAPSSLIFDDNTITSGGAGLFAEECTSYDNLSVQGNTISLSTSGSPSAGGIIVGYDSWTNWNAAGSPYMGRVVISNNTVNSGTVAGHSLLAGFGVRGADISNNLLIAPVNIPLVIKGDDNTAKRNILDGDQPVFLRGAINTNFTDNTIVSTGDIGIKIEDFGRDPADNYIANNIIDAGGGGTYCYEISNQTPAANITWNTVIEYNAYNAGSLGVALLDNVALATSQGVGGTAEKWATASNFSPANFWTGNDENSIDEDPQLDSDYKSHNPLVLQGGMPNANGDETPIGAVGTVSGGGGYRSRLN